MSSLISIDQLKLGLKTAQKEAKQLAKEVQEKRNLQSRIENQRRELKKVNRNMALGKQRESKKKKVIEGRVVDFQEKINEIVQEENSKLTKRDRQEAIDELLSKQSAMVKSIRNLKSEDSYKE